MMLLAISESMQGHLTDTVALAAVAVIGYLFGRRSRQISCNEPADPKLREELTRAAKLAQELQQIAGRIRQDVATHQANITQFKTRVAQEQSRVSDDAWQVLSAEAESLLVPTMKLATDLSLAYDQLRKQSLQLMNFAGSRTDPHTGLHNRRAMEEQLEVLLMLHQQNASRFCLALFSLVCGEASLAGEQDDSEIEAALQDFVDLLESCARDTDVVARYSSEEFVVLMPQTSLAGGMIFSDRLLHRANAEEQRLQNCTIAGGVVEVQAEDTAEKLLSRADSALYSARSQGYSCLYQHNGKTLREHGVGKNLTLPLETVQSAIDG